MNTLFNIVKAFLTFFSFTNLIFFASETTSLGVSSLQSTFQLSTDKQQNAANAGPQRRLCDVAKLKNIKQEY